MDSNHTNCSRNKDWKKRSEQHEKKLKNEGKHEELKAYRIRLESRDMPGIADNAIAIAKLMLSYNTLQMRAVQFAAYCEKVQKEQAETSE